MRPIVVSLDVIKVGGGLESVIMPIQSTQPAKDIPVIRNKAGDDRHKRLADESQDNHHEWFEYCT